MASYLNSLNLYGNAAQPFTSAVNYGQSNSAASLLLNSIFSNANTINANKSYSNNNSADSLIMQLLISLLSLKPKAKAKSTDNTTNATNTNNDTISAANDAKVSNTNTQTIAKPSAEYTSKIDTAKKYASETIKIPKFEMPEYSREETFSDGGRTETRYQKHIENGFIEAKFIKRPDGSSGWDISTITEDENGKTSVTDIYDANKNFAGRRIFQFDTNGKYTGYSEYDASGNIKNKKVRDDLYEFSTINSNDGSDTIPTSLTTTNSAKMTKTNFTTGKSYSVTNTAPGMWVTEDGTQLAVSNFSQHKELIKLIDSKIN